MIDVQTEEILRLHDARNLPWLKGRDGGRVDVGTLRRWSLKGVKGTVLETIRIGNTTYTSVAAILTFIERLSNGKPAGTLRPTTEHRRAIAAADKRLDDAGIK
jgi:hypothetical protein